MGGKTSISSSLCFDSINVGMKSWNSESLILRIPKIYTGSLDLVIHMLINHMNKNFFDN